MKLSGDVANIVQGFIRQTYDDALNCVDTNYFGCKRITEALLPLLEKSTYPTVIWPGLLSLNESFLHQIYFKLINSGSGINNYKRVIYTVTQMKNSQP